MSPSLVQVMIEATSEAMKRAVKATAATARAYVRRAWVHAAPFEPADGAVDLGFDVGSVIVEVRFGRLQSKAHGGLGVGRCE